MSAVGSSSRDFIADVCWLTDTTQVRFPTDRIVSAFLPQDQTPPANTHFANQVHGTDVVLLSPATAPHAAQRSAADALIATAPGQTVAVKTADCLPLLIADQDTRAVAVVHAGWRGLFAGVLQNTIGSLEGMGCQRSRLSIVIGPSIGPARFEVGPEVVSALTQALDKAGEATINLCLYKGRADRWHIDLQMAACLLLREQQIPADQIQVVRICTYDNDAFASYRRSSANTGRNWSYIGIR